MKKSEIAAIERKIRALGLVGYGGACGAAAIEINKKVFGGKGNYVGGFNEFWLDRGVARGHIAVSFGGKFWDSNGLVSHEELEDFGVLNTEDPDYAAPGWNDAAAEKSVLVEFDDEAEVKRAMRWKGQTPRRPSR